MILWYNRVLTIVDKYIWYIIGISFVLDVCYIQSKIWILFQIPMIITALLITFWLLASYFKGPKVNE